MKLQLKNVNVTVPNVDKIIKSNKVSFGQNEF